MANHFIICSQIPLSEKLVIFQIFFIFIQSAILFWTALILRKYTKETQKIREETSESNKISSKQIENLNRTSAADFILKFKHDIFSSSTLQVVEYISNGIIKYNGEAQKFEVTGWKVLGGSMFSANIRDISCYEMDNIIGHFEDLGVLYKRDVVPIDLIYEFFDEYIETFWENEEIQKYITEQNKVPGNYKIYSHFKLIYEQCRKYEQSLKDEEKDA